MNSVLADEVLIESDTVAKAVFKYGLPVTSGAQAPTLNFYDPINYNVSHSAKIATSANISNTLSATAINSTVTCSFQGGCLI